MSMDNYGFARVARGQRLISSRSGNVSMLFGLSVTLLFAAGGGAIDFAKYHQTKSQSQAALDSATLAGGRALQVTTTNASAAAITAATDFYAKMKAESAADATPVFTVTDNGLGIKGELTLTVNNMFLSVIGIKTTTSTLVSEAVIASGSNAGTNLEISMMLDTTGSMSGQKIADLKSAAKDLVDIIVWDQQGTYTSKVALAPFSSKVNVGSYLTHITDVDATRNGKLGITCVTERTGAEEYTDAKPVGGKRLGANNGTTGNTAKTSSSNYSNSGECKSSSGTVIPEIMPLSSNKTALKTRIDELPASGSTAGALGTAWAWYLLSPTWDGIWTGDAKPAPYSDLTATSSKGQPKLMKVAVLMTDGIYNTTLGTSYGDTSSQATTISDKAVQLCTNMKAAGIKVYTIGFQLGGSELATSTLKACASRDANDPADQPSYFFSAATGDELRGAFRQIALQLSSLRLSR